MPDLNIYIETEISEPRSFAASSEMTVGEIVRRVAPDLNLSADRAWTLEDRKTGRVLHENRSMAESGVHSGDYLLLKIGDKPALTCPHCGLVDRSYVGSPQFCRECGTPFTASPKTLQVTVLRPEAQAFQHPCPPEMIAADLLARALEGYTKNQSSWQLCDQQDRRVLNLAQSLEANGVQKACTLYLEKKVTKPVPWGWIFLIASAVLAIAIITFLLLHRPSRPASVLLSPSTSELHSSQTLQFSVRQGDRDLPATWSLSPEVGTIDTNGLYRAPTRITAAQQVTVRATTTNPNRTTVAGIELRLDSASQSAIAITPLTASLEAGQSLKFAALIDGIENKDLHWSKPELGTLTDDGTYTAPPLIPAASIVTIGVTSADGKLTANASVNLTPISVRLHTQVTTVRALETLQLNGVVKGTSNHRVQWSVVGPGSISNRGLYYAPPLLTAAQDVRITATSLADPTKSASVSLQVLPAVVVTIEPASATAFILQRVPFTVHVTGAPDSRVSLRLSGPGQLLPNGTYQAPASIPATETSTITATSVASPDKSAVAHVTLNPLMISLGPANLRMRALQRVELKAVVTGSVNTALRWSLSGPGALSNGIYTAPANIPSEQTAKVTATSLADPTQSASLVIALAPSVSARLGSLVWSGSLGKDEKVTVDGAFASVGSIQGRLPGVPVRVSIDNDKEFAIVDPPGIGNDWRKLTVRSKRGRGTTFRITWVISP